MINDNPITYLVLALVLAVTVMAILNAHANEHPVRKDYGRVKNWGYDVRRWGE